MGSSRLTLPFSTSCMTATPAMTLDTEPTFQTVPPSAGVRLSSSAQPTPPEKTMAPFRDTATAMPGTPVSSRICSM